MEIQLRAALIDWLRCDPLLTDAVNIVAEEAPLRASLPWLGIAASASADWSTKDRVGREVRVALELHTRGSEPGGAGAVVRTLESRIAALPSIASVTFLRARAEQRAGNTRATLLEYRFRLLSTEN